MGLLGNRPVVSPWENGVAPGMQQQQVGLLNSFPQQAPLISLQSRVS